MLYKFCPNAWQNLTNYPELKGKNSPWCSPCGFRNPKIHRSFPGVLSEYFTFVSPKSDRRVALPLNPKWGMRTYLPLVQSWHRPLTEVRWRRRHGHLWSTDSEGFSGVCYPGRGELSSFLKAEVKNVDKLNASMSEVKMWEKWFYTKSVFSEGKSRRFQEQ